MLLQVPILKTSTFRGKDVWVKSIEGPQLTIIDGSNPSHPDTASCVYFVSGEGRGAIIDGFTLTSGGGVSRGDWGFYGGGVYSDGASPTIRNNIMIGNYPGSQNNPWDTSGGGTYSFYGSPLIERNLIVGHSTSYIGGGIGISFCYADIINNTIVGNRTGSGGGISFWRYTGSTVKNNIIVMNHFGGGIWAGAEDPGLSYNDVWHNYSGDYWECFAGAGDISEDPLFVIGHLDFRLRENSPCIDAGDPDSPPDPDGTRADMGAYYFHQTPETPIDIRMIPDGIIYQRGDTLGFTVQAVNNTPDTIHFQGWTEGVTPWGELYSPLLGPINTALGPYEAVTAHYTQIIPHYILITGPYLYRVYAGNYPDEVIDDDEFEFYIIPDKKLEAK